MLTINEIFHSIQGESTHAGRPCVFVRLTACDLRCRWCDTPYAFHEGRKMSVDEVMADVEARGCPVVEVTGGEPLLQADVYPLMQRLLDAGKTVLIETGGHRSIAQVPAGVVRIMDIKCPGSGESARNDWSNLALLTPTDRRSRRLRVRPRHRRAREPDWPRGRRAVFARSRCAGCEAAGRVGDRRPARGARATADAQVHLESGDPRCLGPSSC